MLDQSAADIIVAIGTARADAQVAAAALVDPPVASMSASCSTFESQALMVVLAAGPKGFTVVLKS